jgi:hypothetical protein
MKIETSHEPDGYWHAIDADNYEAESDSVGAWSTSPQGVDDTEIGAIRDLLDQIEDRASSIKADERTAERQR